MSSYGYARSAMTPTHRPCKPKYSQKKFSTTFSITFNQEKPISSQHLISSIIHFCFLEFFSFLCYFVKFKELQSKSLVKFHVNVMNCQKPNKPLKSENYKLHSRSITLLLNGSSATADSKHEKKESVLVCFVLYSIVVIVGA